MTRPVIDSGSSYSFSEMLEHFGNSSYTPHSLSDYYYGEYEFWYDPDAPKPSMTITAAEGSDGFTSSHTAISLTFTSSEATSDFAVGDVSVSNGVLSNFAASSSTVYTATFTAAATGATTIDVAADLFHGTTTNAPNSVATQFNWTTTATPASGTTGRIVIFYRPRWTSTSYRGDFQIDSISVNSSDPSYTFNSSNDGWEYKSWSSNYKDAQADLASAYSNSEGGWTSIYTSSSSARFNRRQGSTPSGSTGVSNLGSYYIYAETSGTLQGLYGARSPEVEIDSGSQDLFIRFASYGSNCGPCYFYWMPTNNSNKTLMYTHSQINTTTIQTPTVSWTAP